jgi:hypothetical protein
MTSCKTAETRTAVGPRANDAVVLMGVPDYPDPMATRGRRLRVLVRPEVGPSGPI